MSSKTTSKVRDDGAGAASVADTAIVENHIISSSPDKVNKGCEAGRNQPRASTIPLMVVDDPFKPPMDGGDALGDLKPIKEILKNSLGEAATIP